MSREGSISVLENMTPEAAKKKAFTDAALQVGEAVAGGLVSGAVSSSAFTGVQSLVDQASYAKTGAGIMDTDGGVETLISVANEAAGVSSEDLRDQLTTQIDKVNQKPTARNIGQLNAMVQTVNDQANTPVAQPNAAVQTGNNQALATGNQASAVGKPENTATNQANTSMNPAEVAASLQGKGIPPQKIDTLAEAIVARVNGQELTQTQREVLRSELGTPAVQRVINELIQKKSNGIDKAQKRMYDKENLRGLNNGEEAALRVSSNLEELSVDQQQGVISEETTFEDTVVAEDSPIQQKRNALSKERSRGGKDTRKPYATSRPSYAEGQIEQVWENAKDPITGKVYDPSGVEITWDPTKPRNGQWDMGHMPDAKYSVMHQLYMDDLMSLEDFLAWYRNPANYRPELPSTNRSHKYE